MGYFSKAYFHAGFFSSPPPLLLESCADSGLSDSVLNTGALG